MRLFLRFLAFCILSAGAIWIIGLSCSKDKATTPPSGPDWTILVYSDGNNNLDVAQGGNSYCIQDIQDLEKVGSTDKVQIVAMVSSITRGGIAKYYHVERYPDDLGDSLSSTVLSNKGTKDMSDLQTLQEFLIFGVQNYPANHYMLLVDDHGAGWPGSCLDEQNGAGAIMSTVNMSNAIENTMNQTGIGRFDIVAFHACLMSMVEVAYEFRGSSNWLLGSEFSMPMESVLGANEWLGALVANPTMGADVLSNHIVTAVYNAGVAKQKVVHFAATDLSKITHLASKVDEFGTQLTTSVGQNWDEVLDAWLQTNLTSYDDPAYVDLRNFALKIEQEPSLHNINLINNAAESLITALNAAVPITMTDTAGVSRGGLTIHMPYQRAMYDSTNYSRLDFHNVAWSNFVSYFIGMIEQIQQHTTISGTVTWPGHQISSYTYVFADTFTTLPNAYAMLQTFANPADGSFQFSFDLQNPITFVFHSVDDINNNGNIDSGEGVGFYDANDNGNIDIGDAITVHPGDNITGVDIVLVQVALGKSTLPLKSTAWAK